MPCEAVLKPSSSGSSQKYLTQWATKMTNLQASSDTSLQKWWFMNNNRSRTVFFRISCVYLWSMVILKTVAWVQMSFPRRVALHSDNDNLFYLWTFLTNFSAEISLGHCDFYILKCKKECVFPCEQQHLSSTDLVSIFIACVAFSSLFSLTKNH